MRKYKVSAFTVTEDTEEEPDADYVKGAILETLADNDLELEGELEVKVEP